MDDLIQISFTSNIVTKKLEAFVIGGQTPQIKLLR